MLIAYEALPDEAWTRLALAADDPTHPMRLFLLATIAPDGSPDARLKVLRGANRRRGTIWFYTDRRSEKVGQLHEHPALCAVAYDRRDGVQLRLRGNATIHELDWQATKHWTQMGMGVRALYAASDPPGVPLRQPDPRVMGVKQAIDVAAEDDARRNFAVIEALVQSIEWLQVQEDDQRRAIMLTTTGWAVQAIAAEYGGSVVGGKAMGRTARRRQVPEVTGSAGFREVGDTGLEPVTSRV